MMKPALILGIALFAAGCGDPIVTAECREGLSLCGSVCLDLTTDNANCGACGMECGAGEMCIASVCSGPDAGMDAGDAMVPVDAPFDAPPDDTGPPDDMGTFDGGPSCAVGELLCGDTCVRGDSDPNNCGACGTSCGAGDFCTAGSCTNNCMPPFSRCGALCLDLDNDDLNCGSCGNVCPTGICVMGMCSTSPLGHIVLLGHSYETSRADMNRLLGNAAFLPRRSPVRVMVYQGTASAASIAGADAAINQVATETAGQWMRRTVVSNEVPLRLARSDVFVILPQPGATDDQLQRLGFEWGLSLQQFLIRGGVIVVLEAAGAGNRGTFQVLESSGQFTATGRATITPPTRIPLTVVSRSDAIAAGVNARYSSELSTVRYEGATPAMTTVVTDGMGPVVIHIAP